MSAANWIEVGGGMYKIVLTTAQAGTTPGDLFYEVAESANWRRYPGVVRLEDPSTVTPGWKIQPYHVVDSLGADLSDCHVLVTTGIDGSGFVAQGYSDTTGWFRFIGQLSTALAPITYYLWRTKQGYDFTNPDTEVMPLV